MRVVRFYETGAASVLKLEDSESQKPGPGEVSLRVHSLGLNRAEVLFRQGLYLEKPVLPARIGYEASGTVEEVGEGVTGLAPGDYVSTIPAFSQSRYGVYGEQALVPACFVSTMPGSLPPNEAASVWMQYLTAYGALVDIGGLSQGQHVVITAASSSVGYAAIQIARDAGAISIATTRSGVKKDRLLEAGADHVIVTDSENLIARVKEITGGKGAEIVFDAIAGPIIDELAKAAAFEGKIFVYGALSLERSPFPLRTALSKGISISGYTMFQITRDEERLARGKKYVLDRLESGALKPVVDRVFTLDQIVDAHEYMESNQQCGKIVVSCD